jgi:hypothetical protein
MSDRIGDNQLERKKMKFVSVGKDMEEWREKQRSDRVCHLPVSLANLRQRVVKIYFPPRLDVTRRTQRSQNSTE